MESNNRVYACAIVGGGLGGLCLAIQLADQGREVVLFEKNIYPFHRVCGEYISNESWGFLESLGVPLAEWDLPKISQLGISAESGYMLNHRLGLGGFGISRYKLDAFLADLARKKGVKVLEHCKVTDVVAHEQGYSIVTTRGMFYAELLCGSYGKYTPAFVQKMEGYDLATDTSADNYIGVKYHIRADLPAHRIELHNFRDGYCGISKVEANQYCLCYLTKSQNLRNHGNNIHDMEMEILNKNPFLRRYFFSADFIYKQPLVVSNVQFHKRRPLVGPLFQIGDAAGTISPLCGNGMSMAMRGSKILAYQMNRYFSGQLSRTQLEGTFRSEWNEAFSSRIQMGFYLQKLFGKNTLTDWSLRGLSLSSGLRNRIVAATHGDVF
ncbi:flavin-dependent dehydrogenase [Dyadobacter jejuensis]|uniref:Flavin-dependent dehydrogenase n=1 Tax=Dyadobacter jejuensis TaxID=1082580 RepID=A0A316AMS4_9BACT|nr:NAD(P)-binding protein [Dyadobacter jejuensis]PWJ59075.1 flavin-dependent dehydrogenase [Dyadobacter jejuensis]